MITNSQLSTTESKKQKQNQTKLTPEQEQIHGNGDHVDAYQWGGGGGEWGERCRY